MKWNSSRLFCLALLLLLATVATSRAEDANRFRPYFRFGSGDISSNWGVDDMWTFALGANFDRHWGAELGIDFYERDFKHGGQTLGEVGGWHLVPQLRLRTPFLKDRLVPYLLAGAGVSFLQYNDAKEPGFGHQVSIEGSTFTVTAGGGVDYFLTDNVALNAEGKYFWLQPLHGTVDGKRVDVDLSAPTLTVNLRVYTDENRPRPLADAEGKPPGRGYIGVRLGGALLTDDRWVSGVKLDTEPSSFGSINQTGGLLFGWNFGRNWGVELAVDSLEYRINVGGIGQIGEYGMGVAIPQLRYRIPLADGRWVPYLNAGMGIAYAEFNDRTPKGAGLAISGKGIYPACSVGGGIEYFLIRSLSFLADAGWVYSWGHELKIAPTIDDRGDFSTFMAHVGFRVYLFD